MISIIVPVYNVEKYVKRCVDSIISQSYSDWELLLVDDGSTDNSGLICEEYTKKDSRIKCFHKSNGGQASARNFGLEKAKGDYISFLDSDDWLSGSFFTVTMSELVNNDADIVTTNYYLYYDSNNIKPVFNQTKKTVICNNREAMKRLLLNNGTSSSVCSRLYKKSLLQGVRFQDGMLFEDAAISYQYFLKANKVVFISEPLMYYLQREGSTMSRRDKKIRLDEIRAAHERYVGVRESYDDEISEIAFSDYMFDMIHVVECFIRDGYDLSELREYDLFLKKELGQYKYKYQMNLSIRKQIEALLWLKTPRLFYYFIFLMAKL
jgi:glycosyltransferase involved in cell wall biosynthesis